MIFLTIPLSGESIHVSLCRTVDAIDLRLGYLPQSEGLGRLSVKLGAKKGRGGDKKHEWRSFSAAHRVEFYCEG